MLQQYRSYLIFFNWHRNYLGQAWMITNPQPAISIPLQKKQERDKWHGMCDTGHVTQETWHFTHDNGMWEEVNFFSKLQLTSSYGFGVTGDMWHRTPDTWHVTCNTWHPILDTRISFVCSDFDRLRGPPWILKWTVLESSGRMASS